MTDFNFFEPLGESKKKSSGQGNGSKIVITILAVIFAMVVISIPAYLQFQSIMMKKQTSEYETLLNEKKSKQKIANMKEKENLLSSLRSQSEKVKKINAGLNKSDQIGGHIVEAISESLPENVFMSTLSVEKSGITIDGISSEKEDVAIFQNSLRKVSYFDDVFVPSITKDEEFNDFSVDIILKSEEESDEKAD